MAFPPISTDPAPDARSKSLSTLALVFAFIGIVAAAIPFVTWFAGVILFAAFGIGLIDLLRSHHSRTPHSIGAIGISVIGGILSFAMSLVSAGLV